MLPRVALVATLAVFPAVMAPAIAAAGPEPVCYTVLVVGPDGHPRYVTVCVP